MPAPSSTTRQYDADGLREDGKAVGSGPYKLDSFGEDEAVFSVNENYKGTAEAQNTGVTLKFFHGDQAGLKTAILDNKVDIAYRGLAASDIADIEKARPTSPASRSSRAPAPRSSTWSSTWTTRSPDKLGVRKAIAYLLDRDALIKDVYQGTATPLYSIIPAGIAGHNTAFFDTYGARPSKRQGRRPRCPTTASPTR